MPDPEDVFSTTLVGAADTTKSFLHIPDVHDKFVDNDGNIIASHDYEKKLHNGSVY
jgi:hypothetical protein